MTKRQPPKMDQPGQTKHTKMNGMMERRQKQKKRSEKSFRNTIYELLDIAHTSEPKRKQRFKNEPRIERSVSITCSRFHLRIPNRYCHKFLLRQRRALALVISVGLHSERHRQCHAFEESHPRVRA